MKTSLIITFILCLSSAFTQEKINYTKIRDSLVHSSCGVLHMDSVALTILDLEGINDSLIGKGKLSYFYDLGMAYYIKLMSTKNNQDAQKSLAYFQKCIEEDEKYWSAYLNRMVIYYYLEDYSNARIERELYKKYARKRYWDKSTLKTVEAKLGK